MKKRNKILLISSIVFVSLSCATIIPVTLVMNTYKSNSDNCYQDKINNLKFLDKFKVKENFSNGGIWENKSFLNKEDFECYNQISHDAFDGNFGAFLDYIELPANIKIDTPEVAIKWENVGEIRTCGKSDDNIFILNNLLFIRGKDYLYANSIADRKYHYQEIFFPCYYSTNKQFTQLNEPYKISNFFYDLNIFSNIDKIKFYHDINTQNYSNPTTYYNITYIGFFAFYNCNKLEDQFTFVNCNETFLGFGSFFVTNIIDFNFICASDKKYENINKVISITGIFSKLFKNFRILNATNSMVQINMYNSCSYLTSSDSFNFELYLKTGKIYFINYNVSINEQTYNSDYNNLFFNVSNNSNLVKPFFNNFNAAIFINNTNDSINFISIYDYFKLGLNDGSIDKLFINFLEYLFPINDNFAFFSLQTPNINDFNIYTNCFSNLYNQVYQEYQNQIKQINL